MAPMDVLAVVACLLTVGLGIGVFYSDRRVKHYGRVLERLRAEREAAE